MTESFPPGTHVRFTGTGDFQNKSGIVTGASYDQSRFTVVIDVTLDDGTDIIIFPPYRLEILDDPNL